MKNKPIQLDELDKKVVTELPFLIDVLTSSLKRISNILENHFTILENEISSFLGKNDEWKLSNKNYFKNYNYPFYNSVNKTITITDLEEYYRIDFYRYIYKGNEEKAINSFNIWIGFEYLKDEEDKGLYLFYSLYRDPVEKFGGINIPYEVFTSFQKFTQNIEIYHPSKSGKQEGVYFYNYNIAEIDKIDLEFEIFRTKILAPYLKNIKW